MTLGLSVDPVDAMASVRLVEVALDAAGAGGSRTYTYRVPPALADLVPGEAVLVEFGRRQALGIILAETDVSPVAEPKAIVDRVRADGPLLPPLSLTLARSIADHYLAPPALVLRAMLPPGLLERLELVAELTPGSGETEGLDPADLDLVEQLSGGARPVRDLAGPDGRAGLLRRLRGMAERGMVVLDWTLGGAGGGPRYERWLRLTLDGRVVAEALAAGGKVAGRALGPRQVAALADLRAAPPEGLAGVGLVASHGGSGLTGLIRRGLVEAEVRERPRRPLAGRPPGLRGGRPPMTDLSPAQAEAVQSITTALDAGDATPLLLDGVTGGGKTAVYVEAITASLERGQPALLLVPEIAMALPLVDRIRANLDVRVALVHSGLGDGERADEWRRIRAGDVDVVVGTRLAVLSPMASLGVVIVDEEHDAAYKSDRTPRLQARDVAIRLAEAAGAACVLGSATPAVDTDGHARSGRYRRVELRDRASGAAPIVRIVDLREELAAGERGLLSRPLAEALAALDPTTGEQAILVLNRRGTASIVLCRDCGHVQACPDCERPLVYHQAGTTLRCHHCGRATPIATRCPACSSPRIRYLGGGTERVEREVRDRFPDLRVGRLDRDVVERKGAAERVIDAFVERRLDVLVGTSLVAKGLDVPSVTLVGVVSSDVALNLPDERAAERTYQLLVQAVGRAGRGDRPGLAFLQTYQPDHPAIGAVQTGDARSFYDAELDLRRRFGSPPFGRLVKLTVGLTDREAAEREAVAMADRLRAPGRRARLERGRRGSGPGLCPATGRSVALERRPARRRAGRPARWRCARAMVRGCGSEIIAVRGHRMTLDPIHATIRTHQEDAPMTDPTTNTATQDKPADETFGWTKDAGETAEEVKKSTSETVSSLFGSLRDALDDLAERASPTVREVGARTAEITALAAHKAAPVVKKAGNVASDASEKLATRSRDWAAEVRASIPSDPAAAAAGAAASATDTAKDAAGDVADAASDVTEKVSDSVADATEAATS